MSVLHPGISATSLFRAFRHKNFRLFISGQVISLIGTWMQRIAVGWFAYELSHSAFWVGVVSFCGLFPGFLFGPLAGSITDSRNRYSLLKFTQIAAMVQATALAAMTISGVMNLGWLIALEVCLALISALDIPVRQSFVIQMVGKEDLPNAIAINSSIVNIGRMIGPAIAGMIIVFSGIASAFFLNAISYIAVIYCIYSMKIEDLPPAKTSESLFQHTKEGMAYAWNDKFIRMFLIMYAVMCTFGMSYMSLMPVFAAERFHMGAKGLSWLASTSGLGALIGTVILASKRTTAGLPKRVMISGLILGCSLLVFSFLHNFIIALGVIMFAGYGMMMQMAGSNTLFQVAVHEEQRGRLMSMFTMAFQAGVPVGALLMGTMASHAGLTLPLLVGGSVCMTASVILMLLFHGMGLKNAWRLKLLPPETDTLSG